MAVTDDLPGLLMAIAAGDGALVRASLDAASARVIIAQYTRR